MEFSAFGRRRCRVVLAAILGAGAGCADSDDGSPEVRARGAIVDAPLVAGYPASQAASFIAQVQAGAAFEARYDVRMYSLTYVTVDPDGREVEATAGVYVPVNADGAMPLISYSHGTTTTKSAVPSNAASLEGLFNGLLQASHGAVFVGADLLGLGGSEGSHPYLHAENTAAVSLDALRAARALADRLDIELNDQLFIYGYSQGGHSAMALHREIEQNASDEFTVTASAPMSGPYDLYGSSLDVLAARTQNSPQSIYAVYIISAWNPIYEFAPRLGDLIRAPYDALAAKLQATGVAYLSLQAQLAPIPADNLQPALVAAVLENPQHPVSVALRENSVFDWRPAAPVRLYYGSADQDVDPQNAHTAAARMTQLGADVEAVDLGELDHGGALVPANIAARLWFNSF